jgi:group I intron endonuclease
MERLYRITNTLNGEFYVGKTHNYKKRWYKHRWNARNGLETHLYRAMRKYGEENFVFTEVDTELTEEQLIDKEKPHYNMTAGGDGGDTSSSPKFIQSMKEYHARRTPESYATYGMLGKKTSDRAKKLIGEANSRPITIEGVTYASRMAACEALGIGRTTLGRRYLGWKR